ncbi:MAG: ATP-binding cassette domain-containing protein, partial [Lachnospiraceae bacterium]
MLLACHHIQKSFGTNVILRDASFHIEEKEKAAIVGINGAGKSTLLKLIVGLEDADRGEIVLAKGKTIGYLAQHQELSLHQTIYEELLSVKQPVIDLEQKMRAAEKQMKQLSGHELEALMETYASLSHQFEQEGGYAYKSEVTGVLKGLGFSEEEFTKHTGVLSGGQKTRIALGKLLLTKPDLLLMDEPTNHLDLNSITWLETYLQNYDGAVILVSHDRYFLDRLARKVIEIK